MKDRSNLGPANIVLVYAFYAKKTNIFLKTFFFFKRITLDELSSSAVVECTVNCSGKTGLHFTLLNSTMHCTELYCTNWTVLYCIEFIVLYCILLHLIVLYYIVLYITVLYFIVLYCTAIVLYCTAIVLYWTAIVMYCTVILLYCICTVL